MNARERFHAIAHFERPDDPFLFSIAAWNATYRRWAREGMPVQPRWKEIKPYLLGYQDEIENLYPNAALLTMGPNGNPPYAPMLVPPFESRVLQDEGTHIVKQDHDGATVRVLKDDPEAMAQWLDYPVKDKASWDEYKQRLDPFSPQRFPPGWDVITDDKLTFPVRPEMSGKRYTECDFVLRMSVLSLFGLPRNYMGLEGISYALYDQPSLVEEMLDWQTYYSCEMIKQVFAAGIVFDYAWIWEDMAYNRGSMVSLKFVRERMAPRYRRVVDLLHSNGVDTIILDSDGDINSLIPIWLDCGINGFYPLEVAGGMDGLALRKKYGRNILLTCGVDKQMLSKGKAEIDGEVAKIKELIRYGGYFPACDHHIPPDVPYPNIVYFLNEMRKLSAYPETRREIPMPQP